MSSLNDKEVKCHLSDVYMNIRLQLTSVQSRIFEEIHRSKKNWVGDNRLKAQNFKIKK